MLSRRRSLERAGLLPGPASDISGYRTYDVERDAWILVAARYPEQIDSFMDDSTFVQLRDLMAP